MTSASPPGSLFLSSLRPTSAACHRLIPCSFLSPVGLKLLPTTNLVSVSNQISSSHGLVVAAAGSTLTARPINGWFTVGDFMTKKEDLHVVKPTTTVNQALEILVEKRITGFPVIDDEWNLVGLVSDYDLLALDSVSGTGRSDTDMFPEVDSTWKTFNELQKLLSKTNGKVVGDLMTPAPMVVREATNLEDAARLLLKTKYRRLPVVDGDGKLVITNTSYFLFALLYILILLFSKGLVPLLLIGLIVAVLKVGIITRGNVVRAALQFKQDEEKA